MPIKQRAGLLWSENAGPEIARLRGRDSLYQPKNGG